MSNGDLVGPSEADLRAIHDFIAHDTKFYARKVLLDIIERSEVLGRCKDLVA